MPAMAWRGESWAEIVARASSGERRARTVAEREDARSLAARAQPFYLPFARVVVTRDGLVLGDGMHSVEVSFAQLYHVEPVDPWPSIALGWVERGESYTSVMTPLEQEADAFAAAVERAAAACQARVPRAAQRGWLELDVVPWERADALPGEREEGPAMRGYRMAPGVADPIVASRTMDTGAPRLLTWIAARLRRPPRRIEPRRVVLTRAFVYVRTSAGDAVRIPLSTLRAARRTSDGDAIYTFGRSTELLLVHQEGCELAAALDAHGA